MGPTLFFFMSGLEVSSAKKKKSKKETGIWAVIPRGLMGDLVGVPFFTRPEQQAKALLIYYRNLYGKKEGKKTPSGYSLLTALLSCFLLWTICERPRYFSLFLQTTAGAMFNSSEKKKNSAGSFLTANIYYPRIVLLLLLLEKISGRKKNSQHAKNSSA